MSRSDKRSFKLNNQTYKKDTDFLKLYNYLNIQEVLDIPALKEFLKKEKITNSSVCIKHLHDKIVNTLQEEARKSLTSQIDIYNEDIERHLKYCNTYLYANLFDYALQEIDAAEAIALELENYQHLVRIYLIKRDMLDITHTNHDEYNELKRNAVNKLEWALKKLLLINEIIATTRIIIFADDSNVPEYREAWAKLQDYAKDMKALPFKSQEDILNAKTHHHYLKKERAEMLNMYEQIIALWESVSYEKWDLNKYIIIWSNLLIICISSDAPRSKTADYLEQYIRLPEKHAFIFKTSTETLQRTYFIIRYNAQTYAILTYGEYQHIYEIEEQFTKGLTDYTNTSSLAGIIKVIFLRTVLIYLILGDYERSGHCLNQYQELPESSGSAWSSTAEILDIMLHYDQGNHIYLQSKIRNLKRQWQKEKPLAPNAPILLRIIEKTLLKSNEQKIPEIWKAGFEEMHEAEKSRAFYYTKLSKWVKTKLK